MFPTVRLVSENARIAKLLVYMNGENEWRMKFGCVCIVQMSQEEKKDGECQVKVNEMNIYGEIETFILCVGVTAN
ncbi:hypothetical protein CHUAL_012676 [Chamberlinius hualienensis]